MSNPNPSASIPSFPLPQNQIPFPESDLSSDDIQAANVKWSEFLKKKPPKPFTIQLSSLAGCGEELSSPLSGCAELQFSFCVMCVDSVECKTVFSEPSYTADALVQVKVFLRSSAPLCLNMSKLTILFVEEVRTYVHTYMVALCILINHT